MNRLMNFFFSSLIVLVATFHLYQLSFFFEKETAYYNKDSAPTHIKLILDEFLIESIFYGKDFSKLNSLKIVLLKNDKLAFLGYCDPITNTIFINQVSDDLRPTVFHELGHCIFGYRHMKNDPIMSPYVSSKRTPKFAWERHKKIFFTRDYSFSVHEFKAEMKDRLTNSPYVSFFKQKIKDATQ